LELIEQVCALETPSIFSPALVKCVGEARTPLPSELAAVTEKIQHEAFPNDPAPQGWERAWCVASVAVGGTADCNDGARALTAEMIVTYQIALTAGGGTTLEAEVHASAAAALDRVRGMREAGIEVTIMGPYGEKLSEQSLAELAKDEV